MANVCNTALPNLGSKCKFKSAEIYQMLFMSTYDNSGSLNKITLSSATALATWQTAFDVYNFSATPLTKILVSGRLYNVAADQADATPVDEGGYYEKLRDGDYNITARLNSPSPYQVSQLKQLEDSALSVFFVDSNGRIFGRKDGTDFYPIALQNFSAQNYNFQSYETHSFVDIMARVESPADMNELWAIELSNGNPNSLNDFYSLQNGTATVSTPAVTGCVVDIELSETGEPIAGLATGLTDYTKWKLVQTDTGTVVSLAASGSVAESATVPGRYTINESALLTTGKSYYLQISYSPFDITRVTVAVP